jgi:Diacylglycerol kinase catalytic domain
MMRLGVVSNLLSTRNRVGLKAVREVLSRHPAIPHFEVAGLAEMPRAVARLAEQRVDTVVVNGGDGTTVTLVTELCNGSPFPHMPGLIVLAGGNTNLIAADVGIPGPPVRALNRVLSAIGSGTPLSRARRHLIRLDQDGEPPRFGFFFGAVGIVRATALARSMVHPLGLKHGLANAAALGLGALRILFGHERGAGGCSPRSPSSWPMTGVRCRGTNMPC